MAQFEEQPASGVKEVGSKPTMGRDFSLLIIFELFLNNFQIAKYAILFSINKVVLFIISSYYNNCRKNKYKLKEKKKGR